MPKITFGNRRWDVAEGRNLLDALNEAGCAIPYGCRAGVCQACKVRCLDLQPAGFDKGHIAAEQRAAGWCLACQCSVDVSLTIEAFDPAIDGIRACVTEHRWMNADVLHLRLQPAIRLRYQAGQHVLLWSDDGVARPYSFASLPRHDSGLDFHIDCSQPGRFRDFARSLRLGDVMRLGVPGGGALRLEPEWDEAELLLIASGTGLAPLWAVLQEARMHGHSGPIRLVHVAKSAEAHYLSNELLGLQARWPQLSVSLVVSGQADGLSLIWRTVSRRTMALVCGGPDFVETVVRQLYMAGLPRARIRTDIFLPNKDQ